MSIFIKWFTKKKDKKDDKPKAQYPRTSPKDYKGRYECNMVNHHSFCTSSSSSSSSGGCD